MSHVLPDLIQKILKGQNPVHLLGNGNQIRHYTHGKDLARGIRLSMEIDSSFNNDFNLSTSRSTSVIELAKIVWNQIKGEEEFKYQLEAGFKYDVQKRMPCTKKAKELLGFEAEISLEDGVKEVIEWIKDQINLGNM